MTPDTAFRRARANAVRLRLKATLRSDDTADTRAENLLAMIGVRWCDDHPNRAEVKQQIADVLGDYMVLDKVALSSNARLPYDAAKDSHDSYFAAVEAIRAARTREGV